VEHAPHLSHSFPWRTATIVVGALAAVELIALALIGGTRVAHLVRPVAHPHAAAAAAAPTHHAVTHTKAALPAAPPTHRIWPRSRVAVLVLNGNGIAGAAAAEAARIQALGYRVPAATNAPYHDYSRSMILFNPGFHAEARRLARDANIRLVAPLDGIRHSQLKGSKLVVILGGN
jgi:LytR cell envelope-related transcriptional attenuator